MENEIIQIFTEGAPPPAGHYAQGVTYGNLIFVSGQLPVRPDGTHRAGDSFEEQTEQTLANLIAILHAAGAGPKDVLKVTAYLVGVEHWPTFNKLYATAFGEARPARAVVPVPALRHGHLIELEAVALRR